MIFFYKVHVHYIFKAHGSLLFIINDFDKVIIIFSLE